ncbi:hypothetical protein [Marinifilum fragile]|uniref:hypothetical protein n=1 Tax=Marinifilum fragile TaxID=570161 RepID=UPI0006D1B0C4|nr:hypothetical protein [Marinifilum fragile]
MPEIRNNKILYTLSDLEPLIEARQIIDGTKGGLILGNSHTKGGIKVIRQYKNEKLFEVIAEFEGWEYILNPYATYHEYELITKINSEFKGSKEKFQEYEIPRDIDILDTRATDKERKDLNKLILLGRYSQFIINKHSTKKHLHFLNQLNKKGNITSQN